MLTVCQWFALGSVFARSDPQGLRESSSPILAVIFFPIAFSKNEIPGNGFLMSALERCGVKTREDGSPWIPRSEALLCLECSSLLKLPGGKGEVGASRLLENHKGSFLGGPMIPPLIISPAAGFGCGKTKVWAAPRSEARRSCREGGIKAARRREAHCFAPALQQKPVLKIFRVYRERGGRGALTGVSISIQDTSLRRKPAPKNQPSRAGPDKNQCIATA